MAFLFTVCELITAAGQNPQVRMMMSSSWWTWGFCFWKHSSSLGNFGYMCNCYINLRGSASFIQILIDMMLLSIRLKHSKLSLCGSARASKESAQCTFILLYCPVCIIHISHNASWFSSNDTSREVLASSINISSLTFTSFDISQSSDVAPGWSLTSWLRIKGVSPGLSAPWWSPARDWLGRVNGRGLHTEVAVGSLSVSIILCRGRLRPRCTVGRAWRADRKQDDLKLCVSMATQHTHASSLHHTVVFQPDALV